MCSNRIPIRSAIAANLNIAVDYFSFSIFVWNFAVVGILSVFWHAPLRVNQGYLVIISAILVRSKAIVCSDIVLIDVIGYCIHATTSLDNVVTTSNYCHLW